MNHNFCLVNADTDSVTIAHPDGKYISVEERKRLLDELNDLFPERIHFEDDGFFKKIIILKIKNYILQTEDGKIKVKGSGIKDQKKPKKCRALMDAIILAILEDRTNFTEIYNGFCKEAMDIKDIAPWCSKHTISATTLSSTRANETRIIDAIEGSEYVEGDRVFLFFISEKERCLSERFNGIYDKDKMLENLYNTTDIFKHVVPEGSFPKYHNVGGKILLHELLGLPPPEKKSRKQKACEIENVVIRSSNEQNNSNENL